MVSIFFKQKNNLEIFYDDLIKKAITQEDLDAVKTIVQLNYIVSKDLLQIANDTKLQQKLEKMKKVMLIPI
ncbi:hypothetical protein AWN65_14435 [Flavobacterium covae]|nr:hypothetical protein AWN65_14435 [Flavobacterium covae]